MEKLLDVLISKACPKKAEQSKRFFKTGIGEYGERDMFLGISVPDLRKLSKAYLELSFADLNDVIRSPYHEARLVALLILVAQFNNAPANEQTDIYRYYQQNFEWVNNWDLVDQSASYIAGKFLYNRERTDLILWAQDSNMWVRRIAIVATHYFIRQNQFNDTLKISEMLLGDSHDLIHKAVGWMLREVGKKDAALLELFLTQHYDSIPRTTLRYAIERFPEAKRQAFLTKNRVV